MALGQLWLAIGNAETALRFVSFFTLVVGLLGMSVALYASLESRRREMAILRAVGAGPRTIVALLVSESALLALLGAAVGVTLVYVGILLAAGPVESAYGLALQLRPLGRVEWMFLALVVSAGTLVGVFPAWKATRRSLADGLSVKV